jgi:hypothetical protein
MRFLDSAGLPAQRARAPVKVAQAIQYRPVYAVFGVRLEFNMAGGVKPLNRLDQSQDARMDQVFKKNMRWKPVVNSLGDVFNLW